MKRLFKTGALMAILAVGVFAAGSAWGAELKAAGTAALDKEGVLELNGNGFPPNAEVTLVFTTNDGVEADIGYALEPAPVADANGAWATSWSYGRLVAKKLVAAGDYELVATDADFSPLARATVTFAQ